MLPLSVENGSCHQVVCRAAIRVVTTLALHHDVVDVLRHDVAAVAVSNFCLQEELAKAIESDRISTLVKLGVFNDWNDHYAAARDGGVTGSPHWRSKLIFIVVDVLCDVGI